MSEREEPQEDQEPNPTKHADAERVTGEEAESEAHEIEQDPAQKPQQEELRDVKGG